MSEHEQDPAGRVKHLQKLWVKWTEQDANVKRVWAAVYFGGKSLGAYLQPEEVQEGVQETFLKVTSGIFHGIIVGSEMLEPAIFGKAHWAGVNVAKRHFKMKGVLPDEAISNIQQPSGVDDKEELFDCIEEAILMEKDSNYQQALRHYFFWFRHDPAVKPSPEEVAEMYQFSVRNFLDVRKRMISNARNLWDQRG